MPASWPLCFLSIIYIFTFFFFKLPHIFNDYQSRFFLLLVTAHEAESCEGVAWLAECSKASEYLGVCVPPHRRTAASTVLNVHLVLPFTRTFRVVFCSSLYLCKPFDLVVSFLIILPALPVPPLVEKIDIKQICATEGLSAW